MGCSSKAKKQLLAQAALARSSRASSGSTQPSTPLIGFEDPSVPSTPSMGASDDQMDGCLTGREKVQKGLKKFGTRKHKSHWQVGETVARIRIISRCVDDMAWEGPISESQSAQNK